MMEMNLRNMEAKLDSLTVENKQLEYCLDASFEESRVIETVLSKMEQDQDRALEKIYFLENEALIIAPLSLSLSLSIYLSIYLSINLSIYLSMYLCISYISPYLSIYQSLS